MITWWNLPLPKINVIGLIEAGPGWAILNF